MYSGLHQAHFRKIIEATPLKEGNGHELRHLHDTAQQHLRALKAMDHEPSDAFVTSILELKLDPTTMFEWHKRSQDISDVPPYQRLLEFLDLRAQASESLTDTATIKKQKRMEHKKMNSKPITSYLSSASGQNDQCHVCKQDRHPLCIYARSSRDYHIPRRPQL